MARIEELPRSPFQHGEHGAHNAPQSYNRGSDLALDLDLDPEDLYLQAGPSRSRPRPSSSRAKRRQAQSGIGGGLVKSMKRGYGGAGGRRGARGGEDRSEFRTKILLGIAFALFLALSGIWLNRIYRRLNPGGHLNSQSGWIPKWEWESAWAWDWDKIYSVMSPLDQHSDISSHPSISGDHGVSNDVRQSASPAHAEL